METTSNAGERPPVVQVRNVSKYLGQRAILQDVSLELQSGQVLALLGPSGAGKSTLLRCINHLDEVSGGRIYVNGELIGYEERHGVLHEMSDQQVSRQRQRIGMVFQHFNLFRHLTALQNVMLGPVRVLGQGRIQAEAVAHRLLASVGLADKAGSFPAELSGGQQQRVAIARALAMEPRLLLLDEPTSALDPLLAMEVTATIRDLARQGYTMVIATHQLSLAREFADRVVFMVGGRVVENTTAASFFSSPGCEESRQFLAHSG
ncbi:MAG: amino acid ABC transporter ATP-binding protein [Steroidobacteraceae bacterium]